MSPYLFLDGSDDDDVASAIALGRVPSVGAQDLPLGLVAVMRTGEARG